MINRKEALKPNVTIVKHLITKQNAWLRENPLHYERPHRLHTRRLLQTIRQEQKEELRTLEL